jgi:hypothetical protein
VICGSAKTAASRDCWSDSIWRKGCLEVAAWDWLTGADDWTIVILSKKLQPTNMTIQAPLSLKLFAYHLCMHLLLLEVE